MTNSIAEAIPSAYSPGIPFPRVGQEMYKMNLEHLVTPDSRKFPNTTRVRSKALIWQTQEAPTSQGWKNSVCLKHFLKYYFSIIWTYRFKWNTSNKCESVSSSNTKIQKQKNPKHLTGHLWKMLGNKLIASVITNKEKYSNCSSEEPNKLMRKHFSS